MLSLDGINQMDLEKEQTSLPVGWFVETLGTDPDRFQESVGIKELTSQYSCSHDEYRKILKELKKLLEESIINRAQIDHYEENAQSGKYLTSTFLDYLSDKKESNSRIETKIKELLKKALQCLMLLNLSKYSRKKFDKNSVNCTKSSFLFNVKKII